MGLINAIRGFGRILSTTLDNFLVPYKDRMSVHETSWMGLQPGDLVQFYYIAGGVRFGLVVSSRRTSSGIFLSTRNNTLLNIVEIESLTDSMFSLMINNLYQNRAACNYYSRRVLGAFLGKDNFRTFNVAKLTNVMKVSIL
mgnify:FL=1